MKKLEINVLTGKITGFSDVPLDVPEILQGNYDACTLRKFCQSVNFPIYKEDVFVEDGEISAEDVLEGKSYYIDGQIVKKEEEAVEELLELEKEYAKKSSIDESKLFMDFIMSGNGLDEARELVENHRAELQTMKAKLEELQEEENAKIRKYWIEKNRETDAEYKYYAAVVLLIKDENRYLAEWLDWHLDAGLEHIYLYDNGSKEKVTDVVEGYPEEIREKITVIDWGKDYDNIQEEAYNHFLSNYQKEVKWVIFLDSDEFLRIESDQKLNEILAGLEDYTEIYGALEEYNANGAVEYSAEPVRERFTITTEVSQGIYHKNFIQANRVDSMIRHYAFYDPKRHQEYKNENQNQDLFVIEHYYTKSWEEWKEKILERGACDPVYRRKLQEFFMYNPDMEYLNDGSDAKQKYQESE